MSDEARKVSGHYGMCAEPGHPRDCPHCAERYERDRPKPTITEFLLDRIDEDEDVAREAAGWDRPGTTRLAGRWTREGVASIRDDEGGYVVYSDNDQVSGYIADYVARHDPARVLAECGAKRRIVEAWRKDIDLGVEEPAQLFAVKCLASVYADHPDYRDEWRV